MGRAVNLRIVAILLFAASAGMAQETSDGIPFLLDYPNLDDPDGQVMLENEHVVVQRFIVPPGEWEGLHAHPGNQVYVHVVGGTWSGRAGGNGRAFPCSRSWLPTGTR